MQQPDIMTQPLGLQSQPTVPTMEEKPEEQEDKACVNLWTRRFDQAEKFLEPYFERDQQAFEFWYMWREFRGPYRSNIFPPDAHAAVESIVPRLTKGRPIPVVKAGLSVPGEMAVRAQRAHSGLWSKMGMDAKWEKLTKRGTWMGFGAEKMTWRTTGKDEPVLDERGQPVMNEDGTPQTRFVTDYHAPVSEIMDPSRVYFPRGYSTEEELPWVIFQYFKRVSELDATLYDECVIEKLKTAGSTNAKDHTLDRDKVHRLPRKSQLLGAQNEDNAKSTEAVPNEGDKDDPIVELLEIYTRPDAKNPEGQFISLFNRQVIGRKRENPTPKGEIPLVVFGYIDDTFNLRGVGVVREMERLLLERADKRNQRMDNVSRAVDGMYKLHSSESGLEDGDLQHRPNGVVVLNDMASLERLDVPDVTATAYREDDTMERDIGRATGANELIVGAGKRSADTLGEADKLESSSNERYDAVIRRLERSLNRHAYLVHLYVQAHWEEAQKLSWDGDSGFTEEEFDPEVFKAVPADRVTFDAKSVIAYKEVSRKQGMQLLELTDKLISGDPAKLAVLKPILVPLLELFDEIKVNPKELIEAIDQYAQTRMAPPPAPALPPDQAQPTADTVPLEEGNPSRSAELSTVNRI